MVEGREVDPGDAHQVCLVGGIFGVFDDDGSVSLLVFVFSGDGCFHFAVFACVVDVVFLFVWFSHLGC